MTNTLIDSNVLLDIFTPDPTWSGWSMQQLAAAANQGDLVINPLIYAEVSTSFQRIEDLDAELPPDS